MGAQIVILVRVSLSDEAFFCALCWCRCPWKSCLTIWRHWVWMRVMGEEEELQEERVVVVVEMKRWRTPSALNVC